MSAETSSIQVVVRLRPMNEKEKKHSTLPVIKASTSDKTVTVIKGNGMRQARNTFAFDNVFTAFSTQEDVFGATLKPVIRDVMLGYESTIFAYGQTGTGKTHTMEGSLASPELYGIIPRSAQAIFEAVEKPQYENTIVTCSYLEIYNEDLGDLLSDDIESKPSSPSKKQKSKLEIMEGPDGPFCRGLTDVQVYSASDVYTLMSKAQQLRKVGETKMNRHSSRSHCLFTIKVKSTRRLKGTETIEFCGKLHMVDLAGSECAKSAGLSKSAGGEHIARERERMNINRSLLTLGRVIKLLKEQSENPNNKKNVRIPYRDSKLTRILQESLGGRCKTLIVATLSPSATAIEESLSTLHYAQSANGIINKPISSSKMSVSTGLFSSDAGSGDPMSVDTWHEMECRLEYMQSQVEEAQAALARKHMQQQELTERVEKAETELKTKALELSEAIHKNSVLQKEVVFEREQKEEIARLQRKTEIALKKTRAILVATENTEVCLTREAKDILQGLEESIKNSEELYEQLSQARDDNVMKREATRNFHGAAIALLNTLLHKLDDLSAKEEENKIMLAKVAADGHNREEVALTSTIKLIGAIKDDVQRMTETIKEHIAGDNGLEEAIVNMTREVSDTAEKAKSSIQEGEDVLSKAFSDAHARLEDYSKQIKTMNSEFLANSKEIATSIETKIMESRDKVASFVASASESLAEVKRANTESCNQVSSVLQEISNISSSSTSNIAKTASKQGKSLTHTTETFESKMNFDKMDSELRSQTKLINEEGRAHMKEIKELKSLIESQKEQFEKAAKEQKKRQEMALSKIFQGVQDMVNEEMGTLSRANEQQHQKFNATNKKLSSINSATATSSKQIFTNIKTMTEKMHGHVDSARNNDILMGTAAKEASSTLDVLKNLAKSHQAETEVLLSRGNGHVDDLGELNEKLGDVTKEMEAGGQLATKFISNDVITEAQTGMEMLNTATTELSNYASNTILQNVQNDIKKMEEPREKWNTCTTDLINKTVLSVEASSGNMRGVMNAQTTTANELSEIVTAKHADFVNSQSNIFREEMKEHKNVVMSAAESHANAASQSIVDCMAGTESIQGHVGDFAEKTMQCNDEVAPLAERKSVDYNPDFTSTPSEEIILKGLDLSSEYVNFRTFIENVPKEEDVQSVRSADETLPTMSDSCSQTTGGSLSRPPMKDRPLEKENVNNKKEPSNERSRSRSRSNSKLRATGKKRAQSRPKAAPTRKRIPMMSTPTKSSEF